MPSKRPQMIETPRRATMSKRYMVLGLSVVLALALAVPALGGPTNPVASISATAKSIANKALKKAKSAQKTANTALSTANGASSTANTALNEAKKAQTTANTAQSTAKSAQGTANSAKSLAEAASAAAAAAEANANTRVKASTEVAEEVAASTNTPKFTSVSCPSGDPILGGGFSVGGESNKVTVTASEEQLYGGGWFADASTINGQGAPSWSLVVVAVCGTK
jgi:membrane protein involved in colicin uptake